MKSGFLSRRFSSIGEEFNVRNATYFAVAPIGYHYSDKQTNRYSTRKYNTLASVENALAASPSTPQVINIIGEWFSDDTTRIVWNDTTPTATNYTLVRAIGSARHNGIPKGEIGANARAYRLRPSSTGHIMQVDDPYITFEGIEVGMTQTGTSDEGFRIAANNIIIDKCIVRSHVAAEAQDGIHITSSNVGNLTVTNCLVIGWDRAGITIQFYQSSGSYSSTGNLFSNNTITDCNSDNNTTYGGGLVFSCADAGATVEADVYNNVSMENQNSPDYGVTGSQASKIVLTGSHNISGDSTADVDGMTNALELQTLTDVDWVDVVNLNYHIEATSTARGAGTNRSEDGYDTDIDNNKRLTWGRGFHEYQT